MTDTTTQPPINESVAPTPQALSDARRKIAAVARRQIESAPGVWESWSHQGTILDIFDALMAATPPQTEPVPASAGLSDSDIETLLLNCGGRWTGDHWLVEDADLHPFVRALAAAAGGRP